jgi:hypothetical protein
LLNILRYSATHRGHKELKKIPFYPSNINQLYPDDSIALILLIAPFYLDISGLEAFRQLLYAYDANSYSAFLVFF